MITNQDPLGDGISAVQLLNHMGDDMTVVNAARVSMAKQSSWEYAWAPDEAADVTPHQIKVLPERDKRLIAYLANHNHWTPFSHCMVTLRIKMPIFVARQWFKHQVGFTRNEVSRRYVDDAPEFFQPDRWRLRAENVKQGSSDEEVILNGHQKCRHCGGDIEFKRKEDEKMKMFCSTKCRETHRRKNTHVGWAQAKYSALRQSATKRGIHFDLTVDDLLGVGQPTRCVYLGLELNYQAEGLQPNSPSVNRIDPRKGYTKDNIEIISNRANSMLLDATREELLTFSRNLAMMHGGVFMDTAHSVGGFYENVTKTYNEMIAEGIAPEVARSFLPASLYTEFWETGSLAGYARIAKLRLDAHAQKEVQHYASAVDQIMRDLFPVSWGALMGYEE